MLIKRYEFDDRLVRELGRFTLLWNYFERTYFQNNCTPTRIKNSFVNIQIDSDAMVEFSRVLNNRRQTFNMLVPEYTNHSLHPRNSRLSSQDNIDMMSNFLEQKGDLVCGCLLIIHRVRNNLMHGLKCFENINDQYDLFVAVNNVLETVERK